MTRSRIAAVAVAAAALAAFASPAQAKTPKVSALLQAQASLSPVEDFVQFNVGVITKSRACAARAVTIKRPSPALVLESVATVEPYKSNGRWYAGGQGEYRPIAGFLTRGETLVAEVAAKKAKKGGKVTSVCKAARITFVVP